LHSNSQKRNSRFGFTLLETMISLGVLGLVLAASYSIATRSMVAQSRTDTAHLEAAMARAILEEYIVTYPLLGQNGIYQNKWHWSVSEAVQPPITSTNFDRYFDLIKITATVVEQENRSPSYSLSTVVTRRAEGS